MSTGSSALVSLGLLRERLPGERRVALAPADVKRLSAKAIVTVETGAGIEAGFSDEAYVNAGAHLADLQPVLVGSAVIAKVRAPPDASQTPRAVGVLISLGGRNAGLAKRLHERSVSHLALERVPRISRAQAMDVLSSQASVAGYVSVLEGARLLDILLPMLTTAAGIIKPAKMIALGAGVAGLQAIATARRLGAVTHGVDFRDTAREQVESLGAKFVSVDLAMPTAEGAGGYAKEQSLEQQERLRRTLAPHLAAMNLVITTAQIPGRPAPLLIDEATIARMPSGSVIVDLAAETGGNCALTRPDELVTVDSVSILGPTNLASAAATDASRLFSGNIRSLLDHLIDEAGRLRLDPADPISGPLLGVQPPATTSSAAA
jgi:proton-translocating NAD(P)+ transhydrogenase subunit alpha